VRGNDENGNGEDDKRRTAIETERQRREVGLDHSCIYNYDAENLQGLSSAMVLAGVFSARTDGRGLKKQGTAEKEID
jgi:hypothetical protein